ncbi:MAG: DUF4893 domain-containing protein [Rhizomicrobium sp.]
MRTLLLIAAAFALSATAAQAGWRETASAFDQDRLAKIEDAKAKALGEAQAGPDMATIHEVLDPAALPASDSALAGSWRCRTIKMGGMTPSVVYSWFRCRIADRGGHLFFEKITGSQRTRGWLYPNGDGTFVYLGASSVGPEKPHTYSGNGASVGAPATPDDQIGLLSAFGDGRARIEMPYPVQESTFDVLELRR